MFECGRVVNKHLYILQSGKKVTSVPSPFVQFTVGHKSFESKVNTLTHASDFSLSNLPLFSEVHIVLLLHVQIET